MVAELSGRVDGPAALAVWEAALAASWSGPPVRFHGDVGVGNLLLVEGRLAAVIDFGTSGVGDSARDLVIAWTALHGRARQAFAEAVGCDPGAWARARGWALWKALITITDDPRLPPSRCGWSPRCSPTPLAEARAGLARGPAAGCRPGRPQVPR